MRKILGLLVAVFFVTAATGTAFAQSRFKAEVTFISAATTFGVAMLKIKGVNTVPVTGDDPVDTIVWDKASFGLPAKGNANWINSPVYVKFNAGIEISTSSVVRFYTNNKLASSAYAYHTDLSTTNANAMSTLNVNRQPLNESGLPISYMVTASTTITDVGALNLGTNASGAFGFGVWAVKDLYHEDYSNTSFGVVAEYSTIATSEGLRLGYGNTADGEPPVWYDFPTTNTYMFFSSIFANAKANRVYGTDTLTFEVQNP